MDKVAVLMAVYNGENYLCDQIDSVLDQTGVEVSLIISLDVCTDESLVICRQYAERDERVTILPSGGSFGNAAYNFFYLISQSNFQDCDFVALADQDDVWLSDKLARACSRLSSSGCDGYSCSLLAFDDATGLEWPIYKPGPMRKYDYIFQGASAGCTYVLSRRAADRVRRQITVNDIYLMSRPSHDWTFYAICRSFSLDWYFDDQYLGIRYRQHQNNFYGASGSKLDEYRKKFRILRSGWYRDQISYILGFTSGSKEEARIAKAIRRGGLIDRLWLLRQIGDFRRELSKRFALATLLIFGLY